MDIKKQYDEYIMDTYGRTGIALTEGKDDIAVGDNGVKFIDFGSGIGTNSLGFCDREWVSAVTEQAALIQHSSNYYYNKPCGDFAEQLCRITGYKKIFFGNSGAEANECAIKLARKYNFDKYGRGRETIITLKGSFHGRTLATLTATGQESLHNYFFPFPEGFRYVEANNINELRSAIDDSVGAIMFEYIQGEGGVVPLEEDFISEIFAIAAEKDILTIADEVQSGAGRTGKFLAGEYYNKQADITTLAKGLGGGLPIGVCLAGDRCKDVLTKGTHGSTFGGNPVICGGGLTVLEKVSKAEFLCSVVKKGELITEGLRTMKKVKGISGRGLMLGINLEGITAADAMSQCAAQGLLVLTAKDKLRFLPPLNISYENIEKAIGILKKILD